jgi:CDP-diacylglycerol--glycerol-3-phosphate 3-phosphatidyltransferase
MPERWLNAPNTITFVRLILSFVLFGMISADVPGIWTAALFVFAVLTDVLDGWIARKYQLVTQLGRIMDPFVDKLITGGVFLFLLPVPHAGVNAWMAIIVIGREMFISCLRGVLEQQGIDFSASATGKIKMFLQCAGATAALLCLDPRLVPDLVTGNALTIARDILLWGMTVYTLWSGWVYIARALHAKRPG